MKENRFLVVLLLCITSVFSQIKGKVVDENNQPIPYVNIWVKGQDIGTTSDEKGYFILQQNQETELIISCVGFDSYTGKIPKTNTIVLKEKPFQINEIIIQPKSKASVIVFDFKKYKTNNGFASGKKPYKVAKFFPFIKEMEDFPFINTIIFKADAEKKGTKILLHIYNVNNDGSPGEELLQENYLVELKKGNKSNNIEINDLNIQIPKEGIFIGFEWLIIEQNKIEYSYTLTSDIIKKRHKDGIKYDPTIKSYFGDQSTTWVFSKTKWHNLNKVKVSKNTNNEKSKGLELAIALKLTN